METENNVVWQDDGQEAVQGDQHDQQEEEQDDEDYCSDLEDKVFNNQLSFWLAENELYSKPVSCTTAPTTNREKVVVTQVTIYTVKQVQNIVTGGSWQLKETQYKPLPPSSGWP